MKLWNRLGVFALSAVALFNVVGCANGNTSPSTFTVGGTVSGLSAAGLVLQNNKGDNLTVSANATTFTFATPVSKGGTYSVTVLTQPAGLNCSVTGGSGTVSANVTSVSVACIQAYSIGGSLYGLTATGLVLQDNGGNNLTVLPSASNYAFVFPGTVPTGGVAYTITVLSDPAGQLCTVANPIGTAKATVTNVNISCSSNPAVSYTIGGTIKGLKTSGVVLQNQAGINNVDLLPLTTNGNFLFVDPIAGGASYNVSVLTQPNGRYCAVNNGTGVPSANVTNVGVVCLGEWTWENGASSGGSYGGVAGVYGTLGVPAATNTPGGRQQALAWIDASGKAWMFGGGGQDSTGSAFGVLNDLWRYDPKLGTTGEWTWMGGSTVETPSNSFGTAGAPGVYGTVGIGVPSNDPGAREQVASWVDASGVMWMFGGEGIDEYGVSGELNDLWKFDPSVGTTGQWTWMGGSNSVGVPYGGQNGVYGTMGTASASNIPGGRYGATTWKDSAGNFWMFGGNGIDVTGSLGYLSDLWKYTPSTGQWTWVGGSSTVPGPYAGQAGIYGTLGVAASTNIPGGRDAGTSWTDASGNFWLFGGIGSDANGNFAYLNDLWKYTPSTNQWTWMGGTSALPSGSQGAGGVYGSEGTAAAVNTPGGRFSAASWTDPSGNFWLAGGQGFDSSATQGYLSDLWEYTPGTNGAIGQWTWMGGDASVGRGGGQAGAYGTLGVIGNNNPGGRFGASSWTDASGNLWLFGGDGYDSTGAQSGNLNDLWKYQP